MTKKIDTSTHAIQSLRSSGILINGVDLIGTIRAVGSERDDLAAYVARLRTELQWYADKVNDCNRHGADGDAAREALANDTGDRARTVLNEEIK